MVQLKFTDFEAYAKAVAGVDGDIRVIGPDRGGGRWMCSMPAN